MSPTLVAQMAKDQIQAKLTKYVDLDRRFAVGVRAWQAEYRYVCHGPIKLSFTSQWWQ